VSSLALESPAREWHHLLQDCKRGRGRDPRRVDCVNLWCYMVPTSGSCVRPYGPRAVWTRVLCTKVAWEAAGDGTREISRLQGLHRSFLITPIGGYDVPEWWPQRRFVRQSITLPLLHKPKDALPTNDGAGWTCDLSVAGARIELSKRFEPQEFLHVRLQTDRGSIEGEARVIWAANPLPVEGGVRHGVVFTHLAPDHLGALRELLFSMKPWLHPGGRLPVNLPVTCRTQRPPRLPLEGRAGNLSRGGMLLRLPRALLPLTELEFTLPRPVESLTLTGAVVWVEPLERRKVERLIAHGLRFTGLDWTASLALARFLAEPRESVRRSP